MREIKKAGVKDVDLLVKISRETFYETFAAENTKENMNQYLAETFGREQLLAELKDLKNHFYFNLSLMTKTKNLFSP